MKKMHRYCLATDIFVAILLTLSILFPSAGVAVSDFNVETENTKKLLYMSNEEEIELRYMTQNNKIKNLILYFDVMAKKDEDGTEKKLKNGTIFYLVKNEDGKLLYQNSVSVDRILHEKMPGMLSGVKLPVVMKETPGQIISIVLKGKDISETTRVQLLGNSNSDSNMILVRYGSKYPDFPLFQIEVEKVEHPYTWDLLLILLGACMVTVLTKERGNEAHKR